MMQEFSITEKENLEKVKTIFEANSTDSRTLKPKQLQKFMGDLGLNNELFMKDLAYYYPQFHTNSMTYPEIMKFLDFILTPKHTPQENIDAFKCFDRNGNGQIPTADLLVTFKKKLSARDYELYSQLITQSYGPVISYMDFFKKGRKSK